MALLPPARWGRVGRRDRASPHRHDASHPPGISPGTSWVPGESLVRGRAQGPRGVGRRRPGSCLVGWFLERVVQRCPRSACIDGDVEVLRRPSIGHCRSGSRQLSAMTADDHPRPARPPPSAGTLFVADSTGDPPRILHEAGNPAQAGGPGSPVASISGKDPRAATSRPEGGGVAFFTVKVRDLTVLDGPQRSVNSAITDAAKEPGSVGTGRSSAAGLSGRVGCPAARVAAIDPPPRHRRIGRAGGVRRGAGPPVNHRWCPTRLPARVGVR